MVTTKPEERRVTPVMKEERMEEASTFDIRSPIAGCEFIILMLKRLTTNYN